MICKKCGMLEVVYSATQYQYLESGLENIYLEHITLINCQWCSTKRPQISNSDLLDMTIAESIILKPLALSGAELRFLRKHLGYSLIDWAELLRLEEENLFDLENQVEAITPQFDLLTRLLYVRLLEERSNQIIVKNLTDVFAEIDFDNQDGLVVLINLGTPPKYYYLQSNASSY